MLTVIIDQLIELFFVLFYSTGQYALLLPMEELQKSRLSPVADAAASTTATRFRSPIAAKSEFRTLISSDINARNFKLKNVANDFSWNVGNFLILMTCIWRCTPLIDWWIDWLIDCSVHKSIDWLIDWLIDRFAWSIDWSIVFLHS